MEERLKKLQTEIYRAGKEYDDNYYADYSPRLMYSYAEDEDLYELVYFGNCEEAWDLMMEFLTIQENADKILSLHFDAPDDGENGTTTFDFTEMANSHVSFPQLKSFRVKLTRLSDHNQSIVSEAYGLAGEKGMIAKLLFRMPVLEVLTIPSAPDKSFFDIPCHSLKELVIQVGYDNQHFIDNLAASSNFPQLGALDFSDKLDAYQDSVDTDEYVQFASFKKLFESEAFKTVNHFTLQHTILTHEELFALQKIRPDLQFHYINGGYARYVSHMIRAEEKVNVNVDLDAVIKAAQKGDLEAQEKLALWYSTGEVVGQKDDYQTLYWRHMAAENGSAHSAYMLAHDHYGLKGSIIYNPELAKQYYRKAADGGYEPARERLQKWDGEHQE